MSETNAVQEHRLGVVAVFVENRLETAPRVNEILSDYGRILVGRMGIPYRERNLSVIAVIVEN
jgi:putative iron-only hydrogenase system regulator